MRLGIVAGTDEKSVDATCAVFCDSTLCNRLVTTTSALNAISSCGGQSGMYSSQVGVLGVSFSCRQWYLLEWTSAQYNVVNVAAFPASGKSTAEKSATKRVGIQLLSIVRCLTLSTV